MHQNDDFVPLIGCAMLRWSNAGNTKSETTLPGHHTKNQYVPCNTHANWQQHPAPDPAKMHIINNGSPANRPWKRNNGTTCPWKCHSPDTAGSDWHCPVPVGQSCESPLLQYILDCVDFFLPVSWIVHSFIYCISSSRSTLPPQNPKHTSYYTASQDSGLLFIAYFVPFVHFLPLRGPFANNIQAALFHKEG